MLRFVVEHIEVHRYPPTIREICEALGIASTNGVSDHLRALERKGHLHRGPCKSRALVPTTRGLRAAGRQTFETIDVPVLSAAAGAGYHRTAPDHDGTSVEEVLRLDRTLLGDGEGLYALRVCGTSMVGDGIRDNDYVFLRPLDGAWPENLGSGRGRVVLAFVDGIATIKRLVQTPEGIRLQASDGATQPVEVRWEESDRVVPLGVVVGVFHRPEGTVAALRGSWSPS